MENKKSQVVYQMNKELFAKENILGQWESNTAFSQYFVGNSYLNPLVDPKTSPLLDGIRRKEK